MAEKNEVEGGQEGEEQQAPSSKKKLIIIIGLAVLVLGIAGAATFFLMGGEEGEENAEEPEEVVLAPALYLEVKPAMLATLSVDGKQRYMQVSLSVMSREQSALDAVEYHMPSIRSKLNILYGGVDFKMAQTVEGKEALRTESLRIINGVLEAEGEALIEGVYFTNFVMQ